MIGSYSEQAMGRYCLHVPKVAWALCDRTVGDRPCRGGLMIWDRSSCLPRSMAGTVIAGLQRHLHREHPPRGSEVDFRDGAVREGRAGPGPIQ